MMVWLSVSWLIFAGIFFILALFRKDIDSTLIIAVSSITGVVVGIIGTYLVQKTSLERQRKWALEDEQKRIKRKLLSQRLDVFEEASKLMINEVGITVAIALGIPMYNDTDMLKEQGKRLQSISIEAWAALVSFGSNELMENYKAISKAHSENEETGTVGSDSWNKAQNAYVEIVKLTDGMRSQI